jgi:hypothetical protein
VDFWKHLLSLSKEKKINYEENAYLIRTDKIESKVALFTYLNKYPLFGYKHFAHINLAKIHNLIIKSEHKTILGKFKFLEYANLIEYNSKIHNWDHLNKFYII